MRAMSRTFFAILLLLIGLVPVTARAQMAAKTNILRETDEATVDEKGDAKYSGRLIFPTEGIYSKVKGNFPNPNVILRNIIGSGGKSVLNDTTVNYDDNKRGLEFKTTMVGAAVNQRNKWRIDVGTGSELLDVDGHTAVIMNVNTKAGLVLVVSGRIELPVQAKNIKIDRDSGFLTYEVPHEPAKGDVSLDVDMKVKARLMPALAKIYGISDFNGGTFWTAKTLFTNSGAGDITHLKISYRIGEYSEWSPPTEYSLITPGGHVVDLYYPILSNSVSDLKSRTPVDLEVKYSYTDCNGKENSDTTSKRITILGANGFEYSNLPDEERTSTWADLFSNSPLVSAFVTKMDDPVRAFGGLVAQASGGQPGGISDEGTIKFCKALYDTEVANHLSYQGSTELTTENGGVSQELKYPRDVLRDKSGTCIELAILYAATCETAGIKCQLMMIPGHCFPVVTLPSGSLMPVEATCISGAAIPSDPQHPHPDPYTFQQAYQFAQQEFNQHVQQPGQFYLVDVEEMWNEGVLVPELGKLPADILSTWGWKVSGGEQPQQQQQMVGGNDQGQGGQPANGGGNGGGDARHPAAIVGAWKTTYNFRNLPPVTQTWTFNGDGTWQSYSRGNGMQTSAQGTWQVSDSGDRLMTHNLTSGLNTSRPFRVDGDTLQISDPNIGLIRFQRAN